MLQHKLLVRATSGSNWDMCSWAERAAYLTTLFRTGHALDLKNNYFLGGPRAKQERKSENNALYGVAAGAVGLPDWAAKLAGGAGARLLNGEPWSRVAKDWRTWGDQPGDSPEDQAGLSMYRSIWGR